MSERPGGEGDAPGYWGFPSAPLVCNRCGALVDRAFTVEHDRYHTRPTPPESSAR